MCLFREESKTGFLGWVRHLGGLIRNQLTIPNQIKFLKKSAKTRYWLPVGAATKFLIFNAKVSRPWVNFEVSLHLCLWFQITKSLMYCVSLDVFNVYNVQLVLVLVKKSNGKILITFLCECMRIWISLP